MVNKEIRCLIFNLQFTIFNQYSMFQLISFLDIGISIQISNCKFRIIFKNLYIYRSTPLCFWVGEEPAFVILNLPAPFIRRIFSGFQDLIFFQILNSSVQLPFHSTIFAYLFPPFTLRSFMRRRAQFVILSDIEESLNLFQLYLYN